MLMHNYIFNVVIKIKFLKVHKKYTLNEYNKYINVTVEILSKPQRAYDEDHQDM